MENLPIELPALILLAVAVLLALLNGKGVHVPWIGTVALWFVDLLQILPWFLGCIITFHSLELTSRLPQRVHDVCERRRISREFRRAKRKADHEERERKRGYEAHLAAMRNCPPPPPPTRAEQLEQLNRRLTLDKEAVLQAPIDEPLKRSILAEIDKKYRENVRALLLQ